MFRESTSHRPIRNRILAAVPPNEYEQLVSHLEQVELRQGEVLSEPDEAIKYVYFPHCCAVSVNAMMADGSEVEVGAVGTEGMCGLPIVFGTNSAPLQALVRIPGSAARMRADVFREEAGECEQFNKLVLLYAQAFFMQTAQIAACNRLHSIDGRLARCLLMSRERVQSGDLQLTQEFLAVMLGVRRAGVSTAAYKLRADGVISYTRGHIHILDLERLEAASCECYGIVKKEYDRLLG